MYNKSIILSGLFIGVALAAPVTSEHTNLDKREGKCDAHIYVDAPNGLALPQHATWKWNIDITGSSGHLGHWEDTNPADAIKVPSGGNIDLWISGIPSRNNEDDRRGALTLEYNSRKWNSASCEYLRKRPAPSNGNRFQFDCWCNYDC